MSLATMIVIIALLIPIIGLISHYKSKNTKAKRKKQNSHKALLTLPVGAILLLIAFLLGNNAGAPSEVFYTPTPGSTPTVSAPEPTYDTNNTPPSPNNPGEGGPGAPEENAAETLNRAKPDRITIPEVPEGETYVAINDNIPYFTDEDLTASEPYANYGQLDELGRVTVADALLDEELMPAEQRGQMDTSIRPTGWKQEKYDSVPGGWLYNRSHLIGFQLAGSENDEKNLMTGTRWFNVEGMLPFENFVANYIEQTGNRVRYRITPVFEGNNMLASGIFMEGFSVDDNGEGLSFNIYVPNRQPGITIDYTDGSSDEE